MSPMDPRLNTLRTLALMWDRSVDWFEEPDEISLEIIPPTHWPETSELGGRPRSGDAATECKALAILAAALLQAAHAR
jgi:hypothetical protein